MVLNRFNTKLKEFRSYDFPEENHIKQKNKEYIEMKLTGIKILIFDVDGVLVYVGDSYRKAIVETVQYYFSDLIGLKLDKYLMTGKDTQDFKIAGGFNDDWELTYSAVLCYLTKITEGVNPELITEELDFDGMIKNLRKLGANVQNTDLKLDLDVITSKIKKNGGGLNGTEKALNELYGKNPEIAGNFWFPDLIKRVFQEFYLGKEFFKEKYRENPIFIHSSGFIRNEKVLITERTMGKLREKFYLGIVTGRERFELEKTMKISGFDKFFDKEAILAREDTKIRKPDPSSLLECRKRICEMYKLEENAKAAYVGDIPDDVMAAKNADFYSIGCLSAVSDSGEKERLREEFRNMECDMIIDSAEELSVFIEK